MIEFLQLYVSGFWVWLGLTIGLGIITKGVVLLLVGIIAALRGNNIKIES